MWQFLVTVMPTVRTDLVEMLESMPALRALLEAERAATSAERAAMSARLEAANKERELAAQRIAELEAERDKLRASYDRLWVEVELFKRRLFVAKAERADNENQLRLEYEDKLRALDEMAGTLGLGKKDAPKSDERPARDGKRRGKRAGNRGTGRRNLKDLPLEEERIDDGRLVLTNNGAERAIKAIALGRKAWLFCGSDDHAKSTAALYSMVASARLHGLDPEEYLRCLIRLVPLWPPDRVLELAPLFWARTRARLDPNALDYDVGPIAIPTEPLDTSAPAVEQAAAS